MQFAFPDDIESVKAGKNVGTVWLDRLDFSVGHRIPPNCFMMLTDEMKMTAYRHPTLGEVLIVPKHHHHPFLHRLVRWFTQWVWMREVRAA